MTKQEHKHKHLNQSLFVTLQIQAYIINLEKNANKASQILQ